MPLIKSAKKKLKQDKKRTRDNSLLRNNLKKIIKETRTKKNQESLNKAFTVIDKAAKKNLIHHNKAARLKSSLSKLLPQKAGVKKESKKEAPKAVKKAAPKTKTTKGKKA